MSPFKKLLADQRTTLLIFLCVVAVYGLSYYKRQAGYTYWLENRSDYVVENVTAMSTRDAYWWLKMARDLDAGKLGTDLKDPTKDYPDQAEYLPGPNLLAKLISLGKNFTGGDYYRGGLLLVPLLAGLFVFPLFLYFHTLGFGSSAILGGLIGSFSLAYYNRSAVGCVDTDLLNLFFPLAVSALVVLMNRDRTFRANLLLAIGAGLMMYLFNWWYQQPGFFLIYLFFIALYLVLRRLPWRQTSGLLLAFALASGPNNLGPSIASLSEFFITYFGQRTSGQIVWPNIMPFISEAHTLDFATKLKFLHGFPPLVFAGLAGLLLLCWVRPKQMVPVAPLLMIGLWSLFGPRRFGMYLAPFIGIGIGVLLEFAARKAGEKFRWPPLASSGLAIFAMLAVFFSTIGGTGFNLLPPGPSVSAATTKAILEIKRLVPKHSAMFSAWSYSYPLMEIGEFATYHDGANNGGMRTTLVFKALTSPRQEDLVALLSSLEEYHFEGLRALSVEKHLTGDQVVATAFGHPPVMNRDHVYILYTEDMITSFGVIATIGTWDFSRGAGTLLQYTNLRFIAQANDIITCHEGRIDLTRGTISDRTTIVPLKAALFVKDGNVVDRIDYGAAQGVYLQVLLKPNQIPELQVVEEPLFRSNFNQQYLLGNFDRRYFEEVYNNFPVARVLKVKKTTP